jgi:hypothetical protein
MKKSTSWQVFAYLIVIGLATNSYSQEKPVFEPKIIKDADGSIYWPLSLPVYIQISSTPEFKNSFPLTNVKNDDQKEFGLPMKWDGPGIHYLKHFDQINNRLPEKEIDFPINVDGKAPVSVLQLTGAASYVIRSKHYFGKGLIGKLTASDDMAKVLTTQYSINNEAFSEYKSDLSFTAQKVYSIKYFSADRVGNTEETRLENFIVDATPPTTTHSVDIDQLNGKIFSPRSSITISPVDSLSGVKKTVFAFDGLNPTTYTSKLNLSLLPDGEHTLNYSSIDNVDNAEVSQTYSFYLDKTPPVVTSTIDVNFVKVNGLMYVAKASTIELAATDNKAGVQDIFYTINGGPETRYTSAFTLPQSQGKYVVKYRSVDKVNNKGAFVGDDKLGSMFVDENPPKQSFEVIGPKIFTRDTLFTTKDSKIILKSIDDESGPAFINYKIDKSSVFTYTQPIQIAEEGIHTIDFTSFDKVNNSTSKSFFVLVDNSAPKIYYNFSTERIDTKSGRPAYPLGALLYLAATDDLTGTKAIYYRLNGKTEILYGQPIVLATKDNNTITIRAVDSLGNQSAEEVVEFFIK